MTWADPGSFRDPASRVVHEEDRVIRLLDQRGWDGWQALSKTSFFATAVADGRLIQTTELPKTPDEAAGSLQHPRLPLITYPYEWTFTMLRDAALLQLDLLAEALNEGLTIKDATPYNIQFVRGKPIFIDVGSFEKYQPGEPWIGYRQFTRQFLFPLMMRAWAGLPFQPWLRGDMEGPTAEEMNHILPAGKRLRPSVMLHVSLQARMEKRMEGAPVRQDLKQAGFSAELILANVAKLQNLIEGLVWEHGESGWSDYESCTHVGRDREAKSEFLVSVLSRVQPGRVLDLGANDGHFSLLAADHGAHSIAIDGHEPVLDKLYHRIGDKDVSIVVSDLTNPSPAQGWAGRERPAILDRAQPDLVVAFGLIHHLIYTASIPPREVLAWLRSFDCPVALEYVAPRDEMVARLTANKLERELHPGRDEDEFRDLLGSVFAIVSEEALGQGSRILFELIPRDQG